MTGHCVLASGGLDSALLLHRAAERDGPVHAVFVRFGFRWEDAERDHLERFVEAVDGVAEIAAIEAPVGDVYPDHWAMEGPVPGAGTEDAAVEIPGRNVLILAKAGMYADAEDLDTIWHGTLGRNPFPDATPAFFEAMAESLSRGYDRELAIRTPLADAAKPAVILELADTGAPLDATFSCIDPRDGRHCGVCNKCGERREAFDAVGVRDPTEYAEV